MYLLQCRVRGLKSVHDSTWFTPARGVTSIIDLEGAGTRLLKALEALNPLYDVQSEKIFSDYLTSVEYRGMQRKVIPGKKSALLTIFGAEPSLVHLLETIETDLIETDRIEVGRRLDYSRWVSFVEIPASIRWSEIAEPMTIIAEYLSNADGEDSLGQPLFFQEFTPQTRVKKEVASQCLNWLEQAQKMVSSQDSNLERLVEQCLYKIHREKRFHEARRAVESWLPLTIYLEPEHRLRSFYPYSELLSHNDPIHLLLRKLVSRFRLQNQKTTKMESFHQGIVRVRQQLHHILPQDVVLPSLQLSHQGIHLGIDSTNSRCLNRIQMISTIYLLALVTEKFFPLLLMDRLTDDLSKPEELYDFLLHMGKHCQLIMVNGKNDLTKAAPRSSTLWIDQYGCVSNQQVTVTG